MTTNLQIALALTLMTGVDVYAQHEAQSSNSSCPHAKEFAEMNKRGEKAMGFSQEKTTHHFRLMKDGGTIEVSAKELADEESRDQIRSHLQHIAKMFKAGNFEIPMLTHGKLPDGANVMLSQKAKIRYSYEQTQSGALVRIQTDNPQALKAVHDFLRFQISEHRTGDPAEISTKS